MVVIRKEEPVVEKTEAQLLIEAKQKKHEEEDADRIREIEEARRQQREREDEELRRLKEKQVSAAAMTVALSQWSCMTFGLSD